MSVRTVIFERQSEDAHDAVLRGVGALDVVEHDGKLPICGHNAESAAAGSGSHCMVMDDATVHDGAFLERLEGLRRAAQVASLAASQ